jgi:hypothetical protein
MDRRVEIVAYQKIVTILCARTSVCETGKHLCSSRRSKQSSRTQRTAGRTGRIKIPPLGEKRKTHSAQRETSDYPVDAPLLMPTLLLQATYKYVVPLPYCTGRWVLYFIQNSVHPHHQCDTATPRGV